jgi:hypothetical protein
VASVQLPFTLPMLSKFGSPLQAKQSSIQISGGKQLSYCGGLSVWPLASVYAHVFSEGQMN